MLRKPITWVVVAVVLVVGGVIGLAWAQPWDSSSEDGDRVDEALSPQPPDPTAETATSPSEPSTQPAGPAPLTEGEFITHEVATTGTARITRNPDGSHQLEIVDLATSGGPALRIWLTDQPVIEGEDGWHVFDDGERVDLGALKGTAGNQLYEIPDDVDPADFTSVSIWCEQFAVSFGAAPLDAA
jgi:hypothetical protein